jgi:hypothetical protein
VNWAPAVLHWPMALPTRVDTASTATPSPIGYEHNSLDMRIGERCHTDAERNGIQNLKKGEMQKLIIKRVGVWEKAYLNL